MTTTAAHVVEVAESQVGYVEAGGHDGHSGNITKFWAELDPTLQGQPWCACFVRWCDKHAGGPLLPISHPYFVPSIVTYARQHGLWSKTGRKGDYAIMCFDNSGVPEHIGRLTADYDGRTAHTVEGNTSSGSIGSQANGGGVYNRLRDAGVILGFVRYSSLLAVGQAPLHTVKHNPYAEPSANLAHGCKPDSVTHLTRVHWVQWACGVPCDGTFGPQTDKGVRLFQHYHGLHVDGIVGPDTRAALAHVTH